MGCQLSHHSKSISYRNSPINKAKSCPTLSKILLGGQKVTSLGSRDLWQRSRIQSDPLTTSRYR
ncbi:hypothetical protein FXE18_08390 [Vibrio cholerae]|nr:hypothetical protein [Vibrio cholerae]TXX77006.1 hypothetical protein FXE96_04565 [Vibrio cholerae]TYA66351.1 hypothetical protein FXE18_08390 [Vibrio cholerae]